jgi:hypothetical protein
LSLDFILSHLKDPLFPRKISTKLTGNLQVTVRSKEEALSEFKVSCYNDCKINAYPDFKDGIAQAPDFIFIDLDRINFKTDVGLRRCLTKTLNNIKIEFGCRPTVIWSGNGYHIYLPIDGIILEDIEDFNKYNNPSIKYLKFAEQYLTDEKSDVNHNPSFKSCMIRIPNTVNSKNGEIVRVVQEWDKTRSMIGLLGRFHSYLYGLQIEDQKRQQREYFGNTTSSIRWIESLIGDGLGVDDGRKLIINLVLVPYLCNIRLPFEESYNIIKEWLTKCDKIRRFDRNIDSFIRNALDRCTDYRPMRLDTLKERNPEIYSKVLKK